MIKTVVILAGGLGRRLRPFTSSIPKPLLPIGKTSILSIIIHHLVKNKFNRIIIATRYKSEKFKIEIPKLKKKYKNIEFILSEEKKKLGTCGPVKIVQKHLSEKFLVINGDIITNLNLKKIYSAFIKSKSKFLVIVKNIITPFEFGKIIIKNNKIIQIKEKPILKDSIVTGIYFLDKKCLDYIPNNIYFGMDDLIKFFLKSKIPLNTHLIKKEYWVDVGRESDYEKVKKKILPKIL